MSQVQMGEWRVAVSLCRSTSGMHGCVASYNIVE